MTTVRVAQGADPTDWRHELAQVDALCDSAPALCVALVPSLLERARAEGETMVEIELEYLSGWARHLLSDDALALGSMERALELATQSRHRAWEGRVLQGLASVYNGFGDNLSALELLERSLSIRRELGDVEGLAAALNNLADTYISMGRFPEKAYELLTEAMSLWPQVDRPDGTCATLTGLAKLTTDDAEALSHTDPTSSRALAERAVQLAEQGVAAAMTAVGVGASEGNARLAAEGQVRLARAHMAHGDLAAARRVLDECALALPQISARYLTIRYHAALGRLHRLLGDLTAAEVTLTSALVLSEGSRPMERADVLHELVSVHEDADDLHAALDTYRQYHEAVMEQRDQAAERRGILVNAQLDVDRVRQAHDQARQHAAELAAMNRSLAHDAAHDALTGLLNRRGLDSVLDGRFEEPDLAYVVADLDLFKAVNDQHSHPIGDEVLRRVSQIMTACLRLGDVVARVGGEEFVLVLRHCPPADALAACERIRIMVAAHPWEDLSPGLRVTMSMGGVAAGPQDDATVLAARADAALYEAKRRGRNQVAFIPPPETSVQELAAAH
ncbi:tetratricopeptide repeat-containing diguanylate cyclase [Cellulomonas taurus]|jgi:diguanylate cyclase (GGDEF)-like protein|uniref:tetratricopeptide repeat-containing diguanylate cyclase n=1 Tax=Cellulomonas taurus TaxID=2729175 RepID=UPI00145CE6A5|nr:diguanylate cyclase [Cellulomonas taurus]